MAMEVPTTYNLSIGDTSPQITYLPFVSDGSSSPGTSEGWSTGFNGSGLNSSPGELGIGQSFHITGQSNASFSVPFTGTGIVIYGLAINSSFSVDLNGTKGTTSLLPSNSVVHSGLPILTSFTGLPQANYLLTLTLYAFNENSYLLFEKADISASTNTSNATLVVETTEDTELNLIGSWTFVTDSSLVPTGNHTFHVTQTAGDRAEFSFQGDAIQLFGLVNATGGSYSASLLDSTGNIAVLQNLSALSSFLSTATLFYASGLDGSETYKLVLTNLEDRALAVESVKVTYTSEGVSLPSTSPASIPMHFRLSGGTIAAIVVASILGFILLCIMILVIYRYRFRRPSEIRNEPIRDSSGSNNLSHVINMMPGYTPEVDEQFAEDLRFSESDSGHGHKKRPISESFSPTPNYNRPFSALDFLSRSYRQNRRRETEVLAFPEIDIPMADEKAVGDGPTYTRDVSYSFPYFPRHPFSADQPSLSVSRPSTEERTREGLLSFLDFASSTSPSVRAISVRSRSTRTNSNSQPSSSPDQQSQKRSSSGRVSLSLSVDVGLGLSSPAFHTAPLSPRHPYTFSESRAQDGPASPTDSIPLTVSDLTFRVEQDVPSSEHEGEKRTSGSHLPPHPPLPHSLYSSNTPTSIDHTRHPHIAQMLLGRRPTHINVQPSPREADENSNDDTSQVLSRPSTSSRTISLPFLHFGRKS